MTCFTDFEGKYLIILITEKDQFRDQKGRKNILQRVPIFLWYDPLTIREGFPKKAAVLLDFVQSTSNPPSPLLNPQFGQLVYLFLSAKNVNLSDI